MICNDFTVSYTFSDIASHPSGKLLPMLPEGERTCVVIGNFDGVHRAHRELIAEGVKTALPVVVVTFDPHPKEVIFGMPPSRLLDNATRDKLLKKVGARYVVLLAFSLDFANMTPEDFVCSVLLKGLSMEALICGYDFKFGKSGSGDINTLKNLGEKYNFKVRQIPEMKTKSGITISSTAVRNAISDGDMDTAASLLGRLYSLSGEVVHGKHRGHELGYPTANLAIPTYVQIPSAGVYATNAVFNGKSFPAVTNVGNNPTFGNSMISIETYIPHFSGDLYGSWLRVEFKRKIRGEQFFQSIESLKIQMASDIRKAMNIA